MRGKNGLEHEHPERQSVRCCVHRENEGVFTCVHNEHLVRQKQQLGKGAREKKPGKDNQIRRGKKAIFKHTCMSME